jgi:hypothetical protein
MYIGIEAGGTKAAILDAIVANCGRLEIGPREYNISIVCIRCSLHFLGSCHRSMGERRQPMLENQADHDETQNGRQREHRP